MAFVYKHKRDGFVIVWDDVRKGTDRVRRRYANCARGDHSEALKESSLSPEEQVALAKGASNAAQRNLLLKAYEELEERVSDELIEARAKGRQPGYVEPVTKLLDMWLAEYRTRAETRDERSKLSGVQERVGASWKTLEASRRIVTRFLEYLGAQRLSDVACGDLSLDALRGFPDWLTRYRSHRNGRPLASRTINSDLRGIRTFFNRFTKKSGTKYFRFDSDAAFSALAAVPNSPLEPVSFDPHEIRTLFWHAAKLDAERGRFTKRKRRGKTEKYYQGLSYSRIFSWVVILTLTGCRRHEAEKLRWDDIDLNDGAIKIYSDKAVPPRTLYPEERTRGNCPALIEFLSYLRELNPEAEFVLPCNGLDGRPKFPGSRWDALRSKIGVAITPQSLRSNWVSHQVDGGLDLNSVARLAGHLPQTSERHYLDRTARKPVPGTLDQVLLVDDILKAVISAEPLPPLVLRPSDVDEQERQHRLDRRVWEIVGKSERRLPDRIDTFPLRVERLEQCFVRPVMALGDRAVEIATASHGERLRWIPGPPLSSGAYRVLTNLEGSQFSTGDHIPKGAISIRDKLDFKDWFRKAFAISNQPSPMDSAGRVGGYICRINIRSITSKGMGEGQGPRPKRLPKTI